MSFAISTIDQFTLARRWKVLQYAFLAHFFSIETQNWQQEMISREINASQYCHLWMISSKPSFDKSKVSIVTLLTTVSIVALLTTVSIVTLLSLESRMSV